MMKESFLGNERALALLLVLIFTPVTLIVEWGGFNYLLAKQLSLIYLLQNILLGTFYNVLIVFPLYPLLKRLAHD